MCAVEIFDAESIVGLDITMLAFYHLYVTNNAKENMYELVDRK
jgi:hypothetical protein